MNDWKTFHFDTLVQFARRTFGNKYTLQYCVRENVFTANDKNKRPKFMQSRKNNGDWQELSSTALNPLALATVHTLE